MMFTDSWEAVKQAADKREQYLVLTGLSISEFIKSSGFDGNVFNLDHLKYLSLTRTCLQEVPKEIGKLTNLTILLLHSNEMIALPSTISKLTKLQVLDCSENKLISIPQELNNLPWLRTVNFASNFLHFVPPLCACTKLSILDLSNNRFKTFPDICYTEFVHLSEIYIKKNMIEKIPPTINRLQALKVFDISDNIISVVPGELADCSNLEEVNLKKNAFHDITLLRIVNECSTKQLLLYLKLHGPRNELSIIEASKKGERNRESHKNLDNNWMHKLKILKVVDYIPVIKVTKHVKRTFRPYIVACIVKNICFTEEGFKNFIEMQESFIDNMCEYRNVAVATHDMSHIIGNLTYTAKLPTELIIKPLLHSVPHTGLDILKILQTTENKDRKKQRRKKQNSLKKSLKKHFYLHLYLYLYSLEDKCLFPCLLDDFQEVISFPPITSSATTKISLSTKTMFVEVTSAISYEMCRKILDQFLEKMIRLGYTDSYKPKDYRNMFHDMVVQQVKIIDSDENLQLIYPSTEDLEDIDGPIDILRE